MLRNFRTYDLAVEFYHISQALKLPRHLKEQLQRAAASIVLNLAEGRGRATTADQKRFFAIAFGSLREVQAILDLACTAEAKEVELADKLAAALYKLIKNAA